VPLVRVDRFSVTSLSQPVPEADRVPLRMRTAGEVDVLARKRIDAAEDADLV
jgi:hypothetical protein